MVKRLDFRILPHDAREELFRAMGLTGDEREWLRKRGSPVGLVELPDRELVSREQQKKAHAILGDIARWYGGTPLEVEKEIQKRIFLDAEVPTLSDSFSLATCSKETARLFINYLTAFCLLYNVPCKDPLWKLVDDTRYYVWCAALNKRCAVCGKKAELHHVDAVGMGRNRKEIIHYGMKVLPLCRAHHTEIHREGRETFMQRHFLEAVEADDRICETYGLRY